MRNVMRSALSTRLARGFVAGTVATGAMSLAMLALQRLGAMGRMPPQIITDEALAETGALEATPAPLVTPLRRVAAVATHFGFGGAMGALFEAVRGAVVRRRTSLPALYGAATAFGLSVWAVSYAGWVPALGILPPPQRDRPGRPASMVLAHVVFGAALARGLASRRGLRA